MNTAFITGLAVRSQAGDRSARRDLLLLAYDSVSYQCRKILQDPEAADTVTLEILTKIHKELELLDNPANLCRWMQQLVTTRCMGILARKRWEESDDENPPHRVIKVPGKMLDEIQTAELIDAIVDALPDEQRMCTVLYCCGKMSIAEIARNMELSEDTVRRNLDKADTSVNIRVEALKEHGIKLLGLGKLSLMILGVMEENHDPVAAEAVVDSILGKVQPEPAPAPVKPPKDPVNGWFVALCVLLLLNTAGLSAVIYLLMRG